MIDRHAARITLELPGHGTFRCSTYTLDRAESRFGGESLDWLRECIAMRTGRDPSGVQHDYSNITDTSALLIVLAELIAHEYDDPNPNSPV